MKIRKFYADEVHGYLSLQLKFLDDLTFVIGINGSGKTTAVRTIHALLGPSLLTLAMTTYAVAEVTIEHEGKSITIKSTRRDDFFTLSTTETKKTLVVPLYDPAPDTVPPHRMWDSHIEFYQQQELLHSEHEVIRFLRSLPTPMYLGLERRSQPIAGAPPRAASRPYRRNIFSGNLASSLDEASELVSIKVRKLEATTDVLKDSLRNEILLMAFQYVDTFKFQLGSRYPNASDRKKMEDQWKSVRSVLASLGVPDARLRDGVDPFFVKLQELISSLPTSGSPVEAMTSKGSPPQEVVNWSFNKWQYDKIVTISNRIDEYVTKTKQLNEGVDRYIELLNSFLNEGGKSITVDRFGVRIIMPNGDSQPLTYLSSGEQQILVLMTHLAFNENAQGAGVLIIDEPELSLHVSWQEKFADALLRANKNIQFILATHSPSIILEKDDRCVELGA